MIDQFQTFCATCARNSRSFGRRYKGFLLDPGTLVTIVSGLLLLLAIILNPLEIISDQAPKNGAHWIFLTSALVGSSFIWWSAVQGIREGDFTADIPVSLATLAAILIGQFAAAAVVAVLLLLGGMLENFVAARAGHALEELAHLLPDRVTVRKPDVDVVVSLENVQLGDLILVRPGERVAVDGEVVSGSTSINQAAITGESLSVEKKTGDRVFAGTLNENGAIEVRAIQIGERTTLGQIRRMVVEAQKNKAPIERVLNRYAKFYTPAAVLLGLILWAATGDILRAITVLIVFCPCVMVLATPTALVASIGNAAMRGSLVKRGATIEALARVNMLIFDKTGTLTSGQLRLAQVLPLDGRLPSEILHLAAAAEKFSEHPIGRATVQAAQIEEIPVTDPESFEVMPGYGLRSRVEGNEVLLGKLAFLVEQGIVFDPGNETMIAQHSSAGRTTILSAINGKAAGLLVFEDSLRSESKPMIAQLQEMGLRTVLLTGDHAMTADRIADELGIAEVYAQVLPQEKVEIVRRLQKEGRVVALVGDAMNDGPRLASAEVGIAMGQAGTDLAIETAEITLLSDDLSRIPHLVLLSRRAMRSIRQNLAFSLGVLAIAIVLTVFGVLTPVTGALLHELSSIPVIANSARLIGVGSRT